MKKGIILSTIFEFFLFVFSVSLFSQEVSIVPRQNYYTMEKTAEILFYVKDKGKQNNLTGEILRKNKPLVKETALQKGMNRMALSINNFTEGKTPLQCIVKGDSGKMLIDTTVYLTILPPKPNAVKIDRLTGTLIVGGLPYIPFGFYTYSPVYPTLPEEEVVKGFNMMSPYQKVNKKTFKQRKAYMDRCAALGMKVNYNLLSVAGEGGVKSKMGLSWDKKKELLTREILAFKDHPALLSWYIADEPVGQGKPPEPLIGVYKLIKKLDPYHPVTMVFMTPSQAWRYTDAMDIVMADPYPIPNAPVTRVEDISRLLKKAFYPDKPLWIAPQTFGGCENWKREPTPAEIRVMTYLALINGARGIQYFIREGLNGFPKSTEAWSECGKIALETAELTPYYAQGKEVTGITTPNKNIRIKAFAKDSSLVIICVNVKNQPYVFSISLPDTIQANNAAVMFKNRSVKIENHFLTDMINALGTRVYKFSLKKASAPQVEKGKNMMVDSGFEYLPVPGVPSAAYAHVGKDRGATYFIDSRVHHSGEHSLRLVTPEDGKGLSLTFFPSYLEYGHTYLFTIWAKAAPRKTVWEEKGLFYRLFHRKPAPPSFTVGAKGAGSKTFLLTNQWKKYEWFVTPSDSNYRIRRTSISLTLNTRGTAWFDDLGLTPVMHLESVVQPAQKAVKITLKTAVNHAEIRYDLQGNLPDQTSPKYTGPFLLKQNARLVAGVFRDGKRIGTYAQNFAIHKALGQIPRLKYPFNKRYNEGGPGALTDGLLAQASHRDAHWQGFLKNDLVATIDLDSVQEIREIAADFLQQTRWFRIFFPVEVNYYVSENGKDFTLVYHYAPDQPPQENGPKILTVKWEGKPVRVRYVRVVAKNMGVSPKWSSGTGLKAWLVCDELIIK